MFITAPGLVQHLHPSQVAPRQAHWPAITLAIERPWYLLVHRVACGGRTRSQTTLVAWDTTLMALLAITIENPAFGNREPIRYQGLVALDADSLAGAFEGYFRQSEQLPTRILLAVDDQRAAGLMLQKLPGDSGDAEGWNHAGALFDTLGPAELLACDTPTLLTRLFHEGGVRLLGSRPLRFACSCSRERVESMLVSLGAEEARAAVADDEAKVRCEFCGEEYRFSSEQIEQLLEAAKASLEAPERAQ